MNKNSGPLQEKESLAQGLDLTKTEPEVYTVTNAQDLVRGEVYDKNK
jgi:hypothetical protein